MYYKLDQRRFARKLAKKGDTYTFNSGKDFLDFMDRNGAPYFHSSDLFNNYIEDHLFNLGWGLAGYFSTQEGYQFVEESDLDENGRYQLWNNDLVDAGVYDDDCEYVGYDKESFLLDMLKELSNDGLSLYDVVTLENLGGSYWVSAKLIHDDIKMNELLGEISEQNGYELVSFEEGTSSSGSRTEGCKITVVDTGENYYRQDRVDRQANNSTEGFPELSGEHLEDWVYWAMIDDVRFDSTDQELENLCDEYEAESNKSGITLNRRDLERLFEDHRDFLKKKRSLEND